MRHLFRIGKTITLLAIGFGLAGAIAGLIYLNQVGFPGVYGEWLRAQLAERRLHLEFDTLRFDVRKGLIATGVKFYAKPEDSQPTLTAEELILDIDKSRALRGELILREILIKQATTHFVAAEGMQAIQARDIHGEIFIDPGNELRIRNTYGLIEGLQVTLTGDLTFPDPDQHIEPGQSPQLENVLRPILDELDRWEFQEGSPPELTVDISGDLANPEKLHTAFTLKADEISRNDYFLHTLQLNGDVQDHLVTLDQVYLKDISGKAEGQADWHMDGREGRFHLSSSLQFQHFLKTCFEIDVVPRLKIDSSPEVLVDGTMRQNDDGRFTIHATGKARVGKLSFIDTDYLGLSSAFSWQDGDLFLQDLEILHKEGRLTGDFLAQGPLVRYDFRSTLPLSAFNPFLPEKGPTAKGISNFQFQKDSQLHITASGTINRENLKEWDASGKARLANFSYRSLKAFDLATDFEISPLGAEFRHISLLPDDSKEKARLRFNGPASGRLLADVILYQPDKRKLIITNLRGTAWPTPIVRAFAPRTAKNIEDNYRFHHPPQLALNGSFDCRRGQFEQTAFMVNLRTTGQTDYTFLKRNLPLTKVRTDIFFRKKELNVSNLSFSTHNGRGSGEMNVSFPATRGAPVSYRGGLKWRDISFRKISETYQFDKKEKGALTGRFDFEGKSGSIRNLNGRGFCSLQNGSVVALPVFGPLSPLIAGILGDKRMGYERAKDASASFIIRNGVWQTDDFLTTSTSLNLTGNGWVDLHTDKIDMTIRLNARGLLGVITLPLAPIKGLFQFRGTGKFTDSKWRSSPFTQPRRGKKDPLFRKPGRAIVLPE